MQSGLFISKNHIHEGRCTIKKTSADYKKQIEDAQLKITQTEHRQQILENRITYMYEKLLGIDSEEAKKIESLTKGYAYAYQVLGSLYFSKKKGETLDDILPEYERILFRDCYDLIWKSLTPGEKDVVRSIYKTKNGKSSEIKALLSHPDTYPVYRNRLMNKHLVDGTTRGYLKIMLPSFDKFISLWGDE